MSKDHTDFRVDSRLLWFGLAVLNTQEKSPFTVRPQVYLVTGGNTKWGVCRQKWMQIWLSVSWQLPPCYAVVTPLVRVWAHCALLWVEPSVSKWLRMAGDTDVMHRYPVTEIHVGTVCWHLIDKPNHESLLQPLCFINWYSWIFICQWH